MGKTVRLRERFCWETWGPAIHVDVTYHLPKHNFKCCLTSVTPFCRTMRPDTLEVFKEFDMLANTPDLNPIERL